MLCSGTDRPASSAPKSSGRCAPRAPDGWGWTIYRSWARSSRSANALSSFATRAQALTAERSLDSHAAFFSGLRYTPTTSVALPTSSGSVENRKDAARDGPDSWGSVMPRWQGVAGLPGAGAAHRGLADLVDGEPARPEQPVLTVDDLDGGRLVRIDSDDDLFHNANASPRTNTNLARRDFEPGSPL